MRFLCMYLYCISGLEINSFANKRIHGIGYTGLSGRLQASVTGFFWDVVDNNVGFNVLENTCEYVKENYNKNPKNILDVGTGTGRFAKVLENTYGNDIKIDAIEASSEMFNFIVKNDNSNTKYILDNFYTYNLDSSKYDIITASFFLHEQPKDNIIEFFKISENYLRKNGIIVIVDAPSVKEKFILSENFLSRAEPYFDDYCDTFTKILHDKNIGKLKLIEHNEQVKNACYMSIFQKM